MVREIIRAELTRNVYSFKFVVALPLSSALVLLSVYLGAKIYSSQLKEYQNQLQASKEELARQADQIGVTPVVSYKVIRPPSPLSILAFGLTGDTGNVGKILSTPDVPETSTSKYGENPIFAVFGILDVHFVVKYILSLLAILFTYDAVCGEKEAGTLKLVLSNPVPRHAILVGKIIGNIVTLLVPLLITTLGGIIILLLIPEIQLSSEEVSRAGMILYIFILFLFGFFFLGVLISTVTHQSRVALLLLLLIWVLWISVIPALSFTVVERALPAHSWFESRVRIDSNLRSMDKEIMDETIKIIETSPKPIHMTEFSDKVNSVRARIRERVLRENAKIQEEFEQRERRQFDVAMIISRISPTATFTYAVTALAGTDYYSSGLFKKSLRDYKERFLNFLERQGVLARQVADPAELLRRKLDLTTLPVYRYTGESLSETLRRIFPDLLLLHLLPILFFSASYFLFVKYDVR